MDGVPIEFALLLGSVAALNPCGFALLPTYLTLLVARGGPPGPAAALRRAGVATAAMTAGFVAVFGAFGLVVVPAAMSVDRFLPWATVVIGVALIGLGGRLVAGRELTLRAPRLGAAPSSSAWSMAGYGVAYAIASLSCTVAPFLAMATSTFTSSGIAGGLAAFVGYGVGMGLVVGLLAVAVALGGDALVRRARRLLPHVSRASGVLLVAAGGYVAYYGVYELRVRAGGDPADPVIDTALELQGRLSGLVTDAGPARLVVVAAVVVAAGLVLVLVRSHRGRGRPMRSARELRAAVGTRRAYAASSRRGVAGVAGIELRSPDFSDHAPIPGRHGHDEENVSPSLEWIGVPVEAVELLLLCEDPDAPGGSFLHWLVTGIDAHSGGVPEHGTPPLGREWRNGFGELGWGGPAPPPGDDAHRYVFRLYALSEPVELPEDPSVQDAYRAADAAMLARGTLVGLFQR